MRNAGVGVPPLTAPLGENDSYEGVLLWELFAAGSFAVLPSFEFLLIVGSHVHVMATTQSTTSDTGSTWNGVKILVNGSVLMLLGIAIGKQMALQPSDGTAIAFARGREIVPLIPAVAGALLTFWGGIRMSLAMRPLQLLILGPILIVGAYGGPLLAVQFFPEFGNHNWSGPSVLLLFTYRIVGLIFFSTALLRLLLRTKDKS